jgi:hypothetical protein
MRILTTCFVLLGITVIACNRSSAQVAAHDPTGVRGHAGNRVVATTGSSADTWREVTIPAGTSLPIVLDTPVGSDTSHVEEPVSAHVARAVMIHGQSVLLEGSRINGIVTNATRSARVKGRAHIGIQFDTLVPEGTDQRYKIQTVAVARTAPATKKKDALEIGAPAAGGALIGALLGGKKGALIGTAVGGGAGTVVVLSTRGKEIRLTRGARLTLKLKEPVTVRLPA